MLCYMYRIFLEHLHNVLLTVYEKKQQIIHIFLFVLIKRLTTLTVLELTENKNDVNLDFSHSSGEDFNVINIYKNSSENEAFEEYQ